MAVLPEVAKVLVAEIINGETGSWNEIDMEKIFNALLVRMENTQLKVPVILNCQGKRS